MKQKILDRTDRTGEHWLWIGHVRSDGYGTLPQKIDGRITPLYAHRIAYETFVGPIPEGAEIDHLCRVRNCVNPAHLEAVAPRINYRRGSGWAGQNAQKTHCKHGHEFTPENTRIHGQGWRACRTCEREKCRRRRANQKENAA